MRTTVLVDDLVLDYRDCHVHSIGRGRLGDDRTRKPRLQTLLNNRLGNGRRVKAEPLTLRENYDGG